MTKEVLYEVNGVATGKAQLVARKQIPVRGARLSKKCGCSQGWQNIFFFFFLIAGTGFFGVLLGFFLQKRFFLVILGFSSFIAL